ncbi:MAG: hypothetical protein M3258_04690 [Thermoproteota archaeon]|nr:hypothetical protein [Thermoproteota archaeon]
MMTDTEDIQYKTIIMTASEYDTLITLCVKQKDHRRVACVTSGSCQQHLSNVDYLLRYSIQKLQDLV